MEIEEARQSRIQLFENECESYGFVPETTDFANCMLELSNRHEQERIRRSEALSELGRRMQSLDAGTATSTGFGTTCFEQGEQASGFNKICYYSCLGDVVASNVPSTSLCPLTIVR